MGSQTVAHPGILVLRTVALTPCWPPPLAGAIHLHALCVYTPALHLLQVTLHWCIVPRVLALRKVESICAVNVAAEQDPLLV